MAPSHLTLSDLERSKSRSLRRILNGRRAVCYTHTLYMPILYYHGNLPVTEGAYAGGRGFPLSQRSFLFNMFKDKFDLKKSNRQMHKSSYAPSS